MSMYLFAEAIKGSGEQIPQAVKLWVERYGEDPTAAMVELLSMLFEACGAKSHTEKEVLDETDVDRVVAALVNLARNGQVEDYHRSKKKDFRNFKENLISFWDNLVVECQDGPLFDGVLFNRCTKYIIALSRTPSRVYRQVATLMGLQLHNSFATLAKTLGQQQETTQRQLNARERQNDGPHPEALRTRLSMTPEKITMLQQMVKITMLQQMMSNIYTELFVHRYRDIDPIIRMSCIESLGVWILSHPSGFLRDEFLNYLGLALNDRSADVRKASLLALQNLYDVDDHIPSLRYFTGKFRDRIVELANDIDVSVVLCAIGLRKRLLRHQLLPADDLGSLYNLHIDDPADIRHAVGELLYEFWIAQKFSGLQVGSRGTGSRSSEVHLKRMLEILRQFSTDPFFSVYLVDDLWDCMKEMKDWKCIVSLLLAEDPPIELTDDDTTNLARLLFACVRKAVGEKILPAFDNRKPRHNKSLRKVFMNHKRDITICVMKDYTRLLRKFLADKARIASLVEIIVYMNLSLYSVKHQEQNFFETLQLIKEAFFKHGEKDVLRSCVKAINFCCSAESPGELRDSALKIVKVLEDELIARIKSGIKEAADGDSYSMLANLKRLYELQLSRAVPIEGLYEDFVNALRNFRNVDNEIVGFLLRIMYLHVAWSLQSISDSIDVSEASSSSVVSNRNILFEELECFLGTVEDTEVGTCETQLACMVCIIFAEAWCLFREKIFSSTELEGLGYCPDITVLRKLWNICERQLNISDETEDEEDVSRQHIEEYRDAVMIAAAKLFSTEAVSKEHFAHEMISRFVMHGAGVAEIVKHLITAIKETDDDVANIFLKALKRAYERHLGALARSDDESVAGKSFSECNDLAARLSGTLKKHGSDVLKIVEAGIDHAFVDAPKQLSFLECAVLHFVSKLPTSAIMDIQKDVEIRRENVNTDEDPSGWRPYTTFMKRLQELCPSNEGSRDEREGDARKRRGRPRKRRNIGGNRQDSSEEEDSISAPRC